MEDMNELDQLLNDIENDGFDAEPSKPKGKREAIEQSITEVGTGFVDTFKLDPVEQAGTFLEGAIPRGIREEYNVVKEAGSELKDLYEKNVNELRGGAKKTVDLIKERTPQNSIYRNILNKISTVLGKDDPDDVNYSREPTQDELIAQQLENVFDRNRKKESVQEVIKEVKEDNKFATNVSILQSILGHLKYDTRFKEHIVENYYRKSLELQFKSLYVTKQQLEVTKTGFDLFKTQLEAIVKNTGLPDLVKVRNSEQLTESIQNRFRENLTDVFYSKANPLQNMKNNIIGNIGKFVSGAKMGFETGNMFLEQANELSKTGMGPSKAEMLGGEAANFIRDYASDELSRASEKNDFIRDKLFKTKMAMADPRETLYNMANEQFDKGTKIGRINSKLLKMVGGITQADRQDFTRVGEYEPDEATVFDYRTKNSIVKVIPSLLSKIYTEVNGIRTGQSTEGLYFDYDTGKLQKDSQVKENILRDTAVTFQGAAGGNLDRFTSLLEDSNDEEFSEEARNHIKGVIVGHLIKNGSMSPEAMMKDEFLEQFDPEFRDLVKNSIGNTIERGKDELQVLDEFKSTLEGTVSNVPLMDKQIEEYFKNGQINAIEEMGLVKYDPLRKMYRVDRDKYTELLKESITYDVDKSTKPEFISTDKSNSKTNAIVDNISKDIPVVKEAVKQETTNIDKDITKSPNVSSIPVNKQYTTGLSTLVNTEPDTKQQSMIGSINGYDINKSFTSSTLPIGVSTGYVNIADKITPNEALTNSYIEPLVNNIIEDHEQRKKTTIQEAVKQETTNISKNITEALDKTKDKLDDIDVDIKIPTIQEILDKNEIDTEEMYTKYQESGAMKSGTNFLSWANTLGYTLMGRKFTKLKEKMNTNKSNKEDSIKESIFGKVKNEIGDMYTTDPVTGKKKLSIAGIFKKTREWDRKMFMSIPKVLGKGMSTAFKSIPFLASGLGNVVKGGAGVIGDMHGVSKKARSIGKEKPIEDDVIKDDKKSNLFTDTMEKVSQTIKDVKEPSESKKTKSILGDKDGDGDRDMGWKDRLSSSIKKSKDSILGKKDKTKPTKKDGILGSIWGMLKGALPFLGTIASLGGSMLSGIMKIGPAIASLGSLLTSAVGGIAKGVMSAGSWVKGKLFGGEKPTTKGKVKTTKTPDMKTKPKGKKPKASKIMSTLKSFKGKIMKKLGKKAGMKMLAVLTAKIAARAVPIAGLALLAYDATMIGKYMLVDGLSLSSAVSKQILGFDINDDSEAAVDENGNPIKPDENLDPDKIDISKTVDETRRSGMDNQIEDENKPKDNSFFGGVMDKIKSYTSDRNTAVGSLIDKTSNLFKTGSFKATPGKEEVLNIIDIAAEKTGVDPNTLKTFAAVESGLDPNAKAKTSSATGLFQFIKSTWNAMLKKYGPKYDIDPMTTPYDPMANAIMGAEYIKENTKVLKGVRDNIGLTDLYMAHFLGPGGAKELFSARPDEFAAAVLPAAARANKSIFFNKDRSPRTVSEVYNLMQNRLIKKASAYGFKRDQTKDDKQATSVSNARNNISKAIVANKEMKPVNNPNVTKQDLNKPKEVTTSTKTYSIADGKGGQVNVTKDQYDELSNYDNKLTSMETNDENYDKIISKRESVRKQIIEASNSKSDPTLNKHSNVKKETGNISKGIISASKITKNNEIKPMQHDYKPNFTNIENVLVDSYKVQVGIKESIDALVEHTIGKKDNEVKKDDKPIASKGSLEIPKPTVDLSKKRYAM